MYIGKTPTVGNFQVCDAISVVNGQAGYTLQVGGVNVAPESANHMLVSLNGILQKPGSSFTISGSTMTFASNLATGDVIDFVQILGNVLDIGTPSDATVSLAKLTATGTKDATTFLRGDNTFAAAGGDADNYFATSGLSSKDLGTGLHIKTGDSGVSSANTSSDELVVEGSGTSGISILSGNSSSGVVDFGDDGDNNIGRIIYSHSDNSMQFHVNASEKMRINSAGKVGIGDSSLPSNAILSVEGNIGSPLFKLYDKRSTSTVDVMHLNSSHGGTEIKHFQIEADGDVQNTNNSYGSLSDRRFKENETDANSQWEDIKALQIKNYNLKNFPDKTHLGVIAQDLEASGMNGLVKNKPDVLYTENETLPEGKNVGDVKEENYKEVKYSVLYMKSVKALQEAMERIETLEAKVTALENA